MILDLRKNLQRDESGQAIILGAVSLLVLAVGIMTTAQLGWAVREKIQLQHAADNAAYTSAAMVARSLNFIAWTNRATVAQYVSAMAMQSYITFFNGINVLLAQVAAALLTTAFLLGIVAKIPFLAFLDPVARALGKFGDLVKEAADGAKKIIDGIDAVIAPIVSFIPKINRYVNYWVMQKLAGKGFVEMGMFVAGTSGENFYSKALNDTAAWRKNDRKVNDGDIGGLGFDLYNGISGVTNILQYTALFDQASEDIDPSKENQSDENIKRAEALMTELINASRAGHIDNNGPTWESHRKFGVGTIIKAIISKGGSGGNSKAEGFLNKIFPSTAGGSILADPVADNKKNLSAENSADAKEGLKKNPVFNYNTYYSSSGFQTLSRGRALISNEYVGGLDGLTPFPIDIILKWISKVGEPVPITKVVGIQAIDGDKSMHCSFSNIGAVSMDGMLSGMCKKACDDIGSSCNEKCQPRCTSYKEDGSCANQVWEGKPGIEPQDKEFCDKKCTRQMEGDSSAKDQVCKEVKQACESAAEEAEKAVQDAVQGAISGITGGFPATVYIKCDDEDQRHTFEGIVPYVSFDISRYDEQQKKHGEPYPTFFAAANKKSTFLPKNSSALGFGDRYGDGTNFNMSSIGKAEGVTSRPTGNCDIMNGLECKTDGYNFNYLGNGDAEFLGMPGFHAWARAQVYYHRPGTWAEPPNLFNPYWKPKLSPIAPLLTNTLGNAGESSGESMGALGDIFKGALSILSGAIGTIISH